MTEFIGELFSKIFNDNVVLATIFVSMVPIMELKGGIPFGMSDAFWGVKALGRWQAFWSAYLGCSIVVVILYFAFVPIMKLLRKTKIFKGLANFIDKRVKKQSQKYNQDESSQNVSLENDTLQNASSQNPSLEKEASQNISSQNTILQDSNLQKVNEQRVAQNNAQPKTTPQEARKKKLLKMLGVLTFVAIPLPLTGVWMGVCIAVMIGLNFWETFISVQLGNLIAGIIISTICVIFPQFTHWLIYIFLILVVVVIIVEIIRSKINKNKQKNKIN